MRAPVHFDDHDLIVVQMRGSKRWYLPNKPSELNNTWMSIPGDVPTLGAHETIDVRPGDLVYLPRGTLHSVDSDNESLHVSIGFTPLTVREAVLAALDQLSDLDRNLRISIGGRLAYQLNGAGLQALEPPILDAVARLTAACRTPGFLALALQRRSARIVGSLEALPAPSQSPGVELDSVLIRSSKAFSHLTANSEKIDFAYPGGHVYIHLGAEESVIFMVNTPKFRVRDIPGGIDDEVRLSLATKLLEIGFLEITERG